MRLMQGTGWFAACLLAGTGLTLASSPVVANVETECQQEAEEYGIPPEQMEDYISGCVLSRGGYTAEMTAEDPTPPEEAMDISGAEEAGTDVAQ